MYANVSHAHLRLRLPRAEILAVILAGVVALDLGLVYLDSSGILPANDLVRITSVTWSTNGTTLSSAPGILAHRDSQVLLVLTDSNCFFGCTAINFTSIDLIPSTFQVANASLPPILPGATGNLTVTVITPSGAYSGPLTIDLA
jgi:hypothetical protein